MAYVESVTVTLIIVTPGGALLSQFSVVLNPFQFIALLPAGGVANDSRKEKYDILVIPSSLSASGDQKDFLAPRWRERQKEQSGAGSLLRLQPAGNL